MEAGFSPVINYYPKGSYVIKVCSHASGDLQGTVYFPDSNRQTTFLTVWNLIKLIEADIAKNHFPQNTFELRQWSKKSHGLKKHKAEKAKETKFDKTVCSFLVQVRYFQNATWQGTIHWMECKQTKTFRSEFELLKLIEEASESKKH
jgi:hypothetical protein